jgi:hypothetical protein
MPIESDEAFVIICSILSIDHIYEIINISDDQIRSVCSVSLHDDSSAQISQLLIKLKEETIIELAKRQT